MGTQCKQSNGVFFIVFPQIHNRYSLIVASERSPFVYVHSVCTSNIWIDLLREKANELPKHLASI